MDIFKKGIKSFIFQIFGAVIGFGLQFMAARILGATEFGKYNYIFGFASSIGIIFSFGIAFYFPKVFQNKVDKKKLLSGIVFSTGIIFMLFFTLFSIYYETSVFSGFDYVFLFALTWVLFLIGYYRSYLIGNHAADKASKIGNFYLKLLSLFFFLIFLVFLGRNYLTLLLALVISHLVILFPFLLKNLKLTKPNFTFLKNASIFYFIQLFYMFFGEFSKVLQGEFMGLEAVALLSISIVIGQIITLFGANFANVGLPIFATAFRENNLLLMKEKFQEIARINAFFVLPLFFFLIFNTKKILGILGDEYKEGEIILILILLGSFINSFVGPNGSILLMSGKEKVELANGFIKLFIALLISFIFGREFIWGIALGLALSEIVVNLLKGFEVYYFYKILPLEKKEATYFFIIIVVEAILFGILSKLYLPIIQFVIIGSLLVLLSWFFSFSYSPNKTDRDIIDSSKSFCNKKLNKLKAKIRTL